MGTIISHCWFASERSDAPFTTRRVATKRSDTPLSTKKELRTAIEDYFYGLREGKTDISNWDTSKITDMSHIFKNTPKLSDEPITLNWDTSNVTNMSWMFECCHQDFILNFRRHSGGSCHTATADHSAVGNECLKEFSPTGENVQKALCNTGNVTNMSYMFYGAKNFNQPLHFDTSNVTNMSRMFYDATSFNQPLNFNTSNVTNMSFMFYHAISFNKLLQINTHNVTNMSWMFAYATSFNQPLNFNTSNVTTMSCMFNHATHFNQPLLFDTSNVKTIECMFYDAFSFNQPIYFQSCNKDFYENIFKNSPMNGQETKYVLKPVFYSKLVLFYMLNQITPELPYLCDEFEEFF